MSDELTSLVAAGGNSRAARSARAKLQWRDRYGRWIEMGRGVKFKIRLSNGSTPSVTGTFVGAKSDDVGQVYVKNDPSGLQDGFYDVGSGNAQEILASVDAGYLSERGIQLGKDVSGNPVGSRIDSDVPNIAEIPFSEAPEGWQVTKTDDNGNAVSFRTDDGDYGYDLATWGYPMMWKEGSNVYTKVSGWEEGLELVRGIDAGEQNWGDAERKRQQDATAEKFGTGAPATDADRDAAKKAVAPYDEDGAIAGMIDANAPSSEIMDALNKNAKFREDAEISADSSQKEMRSTAEREADARYGAAFASVGKLGGGNSAADPNAPTDAPETDGVAKQGFIIPTGKMVSDISTEGIASLIESEKDYLTESGGKRLVIDDEAGTAEIYTSAETLDDAKAQAGGIGAPSFIDLASGEVIENDKNVGAPEGNTNPEGVTAPENEGDVNGQEDSSDPEQSEGNDSGSDSAVDRAGNAEPAESRESLQRKLDRLNAQYPRTEDPAALERLDREIEDAERKLADLDAEPEAPSEPAPDADEADAPESDPEPAEEAPEAEEEPEPAAPAPAEKIDRSGELLEQTPEEKQAQLDKLYERVLRAKDPDTVDKLEEQIARLEADLESQPEATDAPEEVDAPANEEETTPASEEEEAPAEPEAEAPAEEEPTVPAVGSILTDEEVNALPTGSRISKAGKGVTSGPTVGYYTKSNQGKWISDSGKATDVFKIRQEIRLVALPGDPAPVDASFERKAVNRLMPGDRLGNGTVTKVEPSTTAGKSRVTYTNTDGESVVGDWWNGTEVIVYKDTPEAVEAPEAPEAVEPVSVPEWEESGRPAAEAYDQLVNDPENPDVQASYDALISAVIDQYREMKADGIDIVMSQGDPYENSAAMLEDVTKNKRLKAFADSGATLPEDHPMNKMVEIDGIMLHANDVFRAVHDYFGHVKSGERGATVSFGPKGEWEAWRTHRLTLPESSWMALWTETRGQNTWTNYANNNSDLPIAERPFAEQKVGMVDESIYAADLTGLEPSPASSTPEGRQVMDVFIDDLAEGDMVKRPDGTWSRVVSTERSGERRVERTRPGSPVVDRFGTEKVTVTLENGDVLEQNLIDGRRGWNPPTVDIVQQPEAQDVPETEPVEEAPEVVPAAPEITEDDIEAIAEEAYNNRNLDPDYAAELSAKATAMRKEFIGMRGGDQDMIADENGEPHNGSAIYEIEERTVDPDGPAEDALPISVGLADNIDGPEGTSPELVSSAPEGFTPTRADSDMQEKIRMSREAAEKKSFGYQDSEEDYANEKFMPTPEQRNIVMAVLGGNDVAVQALAGTGKTSTLELMARRIQEEYPDKKILYIAFNKSVQEEAEGRMPSNVETRTGDSLGWTGISRDITSKMNKENMLILPRDIAANWNIQDTEFNGEEVEAEDIARDLLKALNAFTISEDSEINAAHFEGLDIPFNERTKMWADSMWADINSKNGKLKFNNSYATKIWALSNPDLSKLGSGVKKPADIIFFDEAQDINPVMAKVVRDQGIQKIYVGDGRQAIYGFRGAENELDNVDVDFTLPLTQSWRFGPEVAGYGNRYLSLIDSPLKIVGGGPAGEIVPAGTMDDADAILTRSNAGAVKAILEQLELGRTVGASAKFKKDLQSLIQSVRWLQNGQGRKPRIHDDLAGYTSWKEIERDVDRGKAGAKVEMLFNLTNNMGIGSLQRAVDSLRDSDSAKGDIGGIDFKVGASGELMEVPGDFGRPVKVGYNVTAGKDAELRLSLTNSFKIKDRLKELGFRFDGETKAWYKEGSAQSLTEDMNTFGVNVNTPVDVIVSTAHKAKGLEWGRVKIGDDFRGPRFTEDAEGNEVIEWPSPEEMRLAYVAVTRAQKALDPGSLSWVEDYTDEDDERPDVPSRGLPGDDNYDNTPAPEASPEPELAPEPVAPSTPEVADVPDVADPEPESTPEVAPEPEAAPGGVVMPDEPIESVLEPSEVVTPLDEPEDDGLPNTIEELEELAGRLEVRIATARRPQVLQREVDKIYDKIDRIEQDQNRIEDRVDEPETIAEPTPQVESVSVEDEREYVDSVVDAIIEGKAITPERSAELRDLVEDGRADEVFEQLASEPNESSTATKPRPAKPYVTAAKPRLVQASRDPLFEEEPNEVLRELKETFPNFVARADGDIVVQSKTVGNKKYDVVVKRTNREKFFAYIEETDLETGNRRVIRLRVGGKQNHSYKALMTQIARGQGYLAGNTKQKFDRKRKGVEKLAPGEQLSGDPLGGFIDGTDLPVSKNDLYNQIVAEIARLSEDPDVSSEILKALATENGFNAGLVEAVSAAVTRRKVASAIGRPGFDAPTHVSYDGRIMQVGQWVDWTDTDRTIPVKDANGKTLRDETGKAINQPNPNYGKVFRGYVQKITPRIETNKNGEYAYTDNVQAIFPDYNVSRGLKPAYQRPRTSAGLVIVPDKNAPLSAPFFAPNRLEAQMMKTPEDFGVPAQPQGTIARPKSEESFEWSEIDPMTSDNGLWSVNVLNPDVRLPMNRTEFTKNFDDTDAVFGDRRAILPGDFLPTNPDGSAADMAIRVDQNGENTAVVLVRPSNTGDGYLTRVQVLNGSEELMMFRPRDAQTFDAYNTDSFYTRGVLRDYLASKSAPAGIKESILRVLDNDNSTTEELARVADTMRAFKDRRNSQNLGGPKSILNAVNEASVGNPDVANAPGVDNIPDAMRAIQQDEDVLPVIPKFNPQYVGDVKAVSYEEVEDGLGNSSPSFYRVGLASATELEVGDFYRDRVWGRTRAGRNTSKLAFRQIVAVDTKRNAVTTRTILPDDKDGFRPDRNLPQFQNGGMTEVLLHDGDVFDVIKPSPENMPKDYFAAGKGPEQKDRPPRQVNVYDDYEVSDQEALDRAARARDQIKRDFEDGYMVDASRPIEMGAINIDAFIAKTAEGRSIFSKGVKNRDEMDNEILVARMANAIGIEEIYTTQVKGDNKYQIAMNAIDGEVGMMRRDRQQVIDNMANNPSAVRMGVLDYLTGAQDRHAGNYMFLNGSDTVVPIDNSFNSWDNYTDSPFAGKLRALIRSGNSPITTAELLRIRGQLFALKGEFIGRSEGESRWNGMMGRINKLIDGVNGYGV